jgi:hypothetical protein
MDIQRNILIFSVFQLSYSEYFASKSTKENHENTLRIAELLSLNPQQEFLSVVGVYKNETELSFVLENNPTNFALVHQLVKKFHQESFLVIDNVGRGMLVFDNGVETLRGTWQVCTERYALRQTSYTFEPSTGTYWVFS